MARRTQRSKPAWENEPVLCVGLDSEVEKLPKRFQKRTDGQYDFNCWMVDETAEYAGVYKPNLAFYCSEGPNGLRQLRQTVAYIKNRYPEKLVILDAKWGDIASTNEGYVRLAYDYLGVDGVTLNPYVGQEALAPFLENKDKWNFILGKTSNPGSGEFQDLIWCKVAEQVAKKWNVNRNCGLVVGATYPEELKRARKIVGEMPILVPGVGAQGGEMKAVLRCGLNSKKGGVIINSSRGIIFADNPKSETKKLIEEMKA